MNNTQISLVTNNYLVPEESWMMNSKVVSDRSLEQDALKADDNDE